MKKALIILGIALVVGIYLWMNKSGASINNLSSASPVPTAITGPVKLAQVAEHDKKDDCWLAIEGKVYDVTPYVASGLHPGKMMILQGCGKDATEMFNNRPGGEGAHSDRARQMLSQYYKAELTQ